MGIVTPQMLTVSLLVVLALQGLLAATVIRSENSTEDLRYEYADLDLDPTTSEKDSSSSDENFNYISKEKNFTWDRYHRLSAIYSYIFSLESQFPERVQIKLIGKSYEDRDLVVLKIGRQSHLNKSAMWIDGGIHAREWISPAVAMYLIRELQRDDELLEKMDFYVMPVMNPDGYEYSHTTDRMWRKTRSVQPGEKLHVFQQHWPECIGVDLNRNWDSHWGENVNTSRRCTEVYQGVQPFSEPESKAVSDFIMKLAPAAYITLHSYWQEWMMPWGHTNEPSEHYEELQRVSLKAVKAIKDSGGQTYEFGSSNDLRGEIAGNSMDWAHEKAGVLYAFTVELRDTGNYGFMLPPSEIEPCGREIFAAIKEVVNAVSNSTEEN